MNGNHRGTPCLMRSQLEFKPTYHPTRKSTLQQKDKAEISQTLPLVREFPTPQWNGLFSRGYIYPLNKNKVWMDFQGVSVITIIVIYNYCNSYKYKWLTINKYITKNFNEHMTLKNTFKSKEPFPKFQSATRGPYIDEITEHVPSRSKITRKSADLDSLDEVSQPICASR